MSEGSDKNPKIIVDDDWKEQVQAEKEALQRQRETKQEPQGKKRPEAPLPPASFSVLVTSLATQALLALGQVPDPSGKVVRQLDQARHLIDLLGVLEDKTKGNLTDDEAAMLEGVLHELRMAFVAAQSAPPPKKPDSPESSSSG